LSYMIGQEVGEMVYEVCKCKEFRNDVICVSVFCNVFLDMNKQSVVFAVVMLGVYSIFKGQFFCTIALEVEL